METKAVRPRWMGARVPRLEDPRLLRGTARYLDDIDLPGLYEIAFVRSPYAAARIDGIVVDQAMAVSGVKAVLTHADIPWSLALEPTPGAQPVLAGDSVGYVGQPVAAVIARDRYLAEDAAELVEVRYTPLEPVLDLAAGLQDVPRRVHDEAPNRFIHREYRTPGFAETMARAPRRLRARFVTSRQTALTLEPRGCAAVSDPASGRLTVYASTQSPHRIRSDLAGILKIPEHQIRVVVPEVGGGFGMKANTYPEDVVVLEAARRLGVPVKWAGDRTESLLADNHARDDVHEVEVGFDDDGRILAIFDHLFADQGAYLGFPFAGADGETGMAADLISGPYDIREVSTIVDCAFSNKAPLGAYRGVWGPVATFVQEGIIDRVARALDQDPVEVRRRNLIADTAFPYVNAAGIEYDRGSYREAMETALEQLDYRGWRRRQAELRRDGRYLGIGLAVFVEPTAMVASEAGEVGYESVLLRVEPSGTVTAAFGLGPSGQGHETTMAQLIADELGIGVEDVVVLHGDTDSAPYGGGTGGSRSATIGGGAAITAGRRMRERISTIAAHLLEAAPADIELSGGAARVVGVPRAAVSLAEIARVAYQDVGRLPPGADAGLELVVRYQPRRAKTFSNGTHAAVVELDPATGLVRVLRYVVANDCGRLINPQIVEGQIQGGVAQGIGSAFFEQLRYDVDGQLTTASLMDYLLPEATDVPGLAIYHLETPSDSEGGIKGMGEGSLIGSPAALASAVADALAPFGVAIDRLPMDPESLWERIRRSG